MVVLEGANNLRGGLNLLDPWMNQWVRQRGSQVSLSHTTC